MRGEDCAALVCKPKLRITPACAGRRVICPLPELSYEDHPRVCGEKSSVRVKKRSKSGSPPRVRGEEQKRGKLSTVRGITPACAGRSSAILYLQGGHQDHPRVCGEKRQAGVKKLQAMGSPPRVRGEVAVRLVVRDVGRITPACAGRRDVRKTRVCRDQDHPRVCGEKPPYPPAVVSLSGSPPRVRGEG